MHRPAVRRRGAQPLDGGPLDGGPGTRPGYGAVGHPGERTVRLVVAEQMGRHPVRHAQGAGEQRALRLGDLQEAAGDQRGPYGEAEAARPGPGQSAQFEGQPDGRPAAGQVVVEVAVELFEAGVEVGGEGHQQDVEVHREQPEGVDEPGEPRTGRRRGPVPEGRTTARSAAGGRTTAVHRGGGRQDPVHRLRAEVLAPVRVVRVRVLGPALAHRGADPLLDPVQALPELPGPGRCPVRGRHRHSGRRGLRGPRRRSEVEAHRAPPRDRRPGGSPRSRGAAKPSRPGSAPPW